MKTKGNSFGGRIMRGFLAILLLFQSFIGYIPMALAAGDEQDIANAGDLKSALENPSNNKVLKLSAEITLTSTITLGEGSYVVDLAGNSITSTFSSTMFKIDKATTNLKITNSNNERADITTTTGGNVLNIDSKATTAKATMENIKFSGAFSNMLGSIALANAGDVTITNCIFDQIKVSSSMGAVISSKGNLVLEGNTFTGKTENKGSLVYANTATVTMENNIFKDNSNTETGKNNGGAVSLINCNSTIIGNQFINNKSTTAGGALYVGGVAVSNNNKIIYNTLIKNNLFENNQTKKQGGAVYISSMNNTFIGNTLKNNKTTNTNDFAYGGGIYSIENYQDTYADNIITNNSSLKGGAIFFQSKELRPMDYEQRVLTLRNNQIKNNTALNEDPQACENNDSYCGQGGGLYISLDNEIKNININIQSGEFIGNKATDGGAIYFGDEYKEDSKLVLKKVLITNNKAARGAGIWLCPKAKTIMHSTLGGAIYDNLTTGDVTYYFGADKAYSQKLLSAGDDIFYEGMKKIDGITDSQYGPTKSDESEDSMVNPRSTLKVISRTWSGKKVDWYQDEVDKRYRENNFRNLFAKDDPYLVGEDKGGTKDLVALHGEKTGEETDALIIMKDNTAERRGGAIFTNNVIDLGLDEDIDITVKKKLVADNDNLLPKNVLVNLVRIDPNGKEETIEKNIELNKDNEWSYTFYELPARNEKGDYQYRIQETDDKYLVAAESSNGENGKCKTNKNCTITLTNKYTEEKEEIPEEGIGDVENPKTGDSIYWNIGFSLTCGLALGVLLKAKKRKAN